MFTAVLIVACSDTTVAPRAKKLVTMNGYAIDYNDCVTLTFNSNGMFEVENPLGVDWVAIQFDYYPAEEGNEAAGGTTVVKYCREYWEEEPPPPPLNCAADPWNPACPPPPPPPPPCNPNCGGDPSGNGNNNGGSQPDSISVTVSVTPSGTVAFGGTISAAATVTANNDGTYQTDGWSWSGTPAIPTTCDSITCEMQVTGTGWLHFSANKGAAFAKDSVKVFVGPPAVTIVCTQLTGDVLIRGEAVQCAKGADSSVAMNYGWNVTVTSWKFSPNPNAFGLGAITEPSPGQEWIGRAVIGGTVRAGLSYQKPSQSESDSALTTFSVVGRTGFVGGVTAAVLSPIPFDTINDYPETANKARTGRVNWSWSSPDRAVDSVRTGPNQTYKYFMTFSITHIPRVTVPWSQFAPNGHYYNLAPDTMGATRTGCPRPFVQNSVKDLIFAHEGVRQEAGSHTAAGYNYLVGQAAAMRARAEAAVYPSGTSFDTLYAHVAKPNDLDTAADAVDTNNPDYGFWPIGTKLCTVLWQ